MVVRIHIIEIHKKQPQRSFALQFLPIYKVPKQNFQKMPMRLYAE